MSIPPTVASHPQIVQDKEGRLKSFSEEAFPPRGRHLVFSESKKEAVEILDFRRGKHLYSQFEG